MTGRGRCCVPWELGDGICPLYWSQGFFAAPRPAGVGRRAAAVAAAAAGSVSETGPEGRRLRCLGLGDGPVCTISARTDPGLLHPLCRCAVQRGSRAAHSSQSP